MTPDAAAGAVLELHQAAFSHPGGGGVSGIELSVAAGESVALIGPNGAGKSTLLQGILGLVPMTAGSLRIAGVTSAKDRGRAVGYLPQQAHLDPDFPITLDQVVMQGRYRGLGWLRWPGRADRRAVVDALSAVGLAQRGGAQFGDLSGGQRQRGLLARALASEPRVLLLDEPFNGLDQPNRDALLETVRELKRLGVALLISTHDLELAREVCDTVVLLNGVQLASGAVDEVLTLDNVQECFSDQGVEFDEHTLVVPGHEGHEAH
jgi:manganese/iron transport system ATP-binding protein